MTDTVQWYHGSHAGIAVGEWIVPGRDINFPAACHVWDIGTGMPRRYLRYVYLTSDLDSAARYACQHRDPMVYIVEPDGPVEPAADCSTQSTSRQCARVRVISCAPLSDRVLRIYRMGLEYLGPLAPPLR